MYDDPIDPPPAEQPNTTLCSPATLADATPQQWADALHDALTAIAPEVLAGLQRRLSAGRPASSVAPSPDALIDQLPDGTIASATIHSTEGTHAVVFVGREALVRYGQGLLRAVEARMRANFGDRAISARWLAVAKRGGKETRQPWQWREDDRIPEWATDFDYEVELHRNERSA